MNCVKRALNATFLSRHKLLIYGAHSHHDIIRRGFVIEFIPFLFLIYKKVVKNGNIVVGHAVILILKLSLTIIILAHSENI